MIGRRRNRGWLLRAIGVLWAGAAAAQPAPGLDVPILYIERLVERPATLSSLDRPPADAGLQGARLGVAEVLTTGRLTGQRATLAERVVGPEEDLGAALR